MEEDEDAFLYGDPSQEKPQEIPKTQEKMDLDDSNKEPPPPQDQVKEPQQQEDDQDNNDDDDDDDDADSDSDSDIEIVIQGKPGSKPEPPARPNNNITNTNITNPNNNNTVMYSSSKNATKQQDVQPSSVSTIDIDKVGQYNGQPITQVNIDQLDDKPWRNPGADITDYFNYGFDEFTWTAYITKQDNLRSSFSPQAIMAQMMTGMPPPPMDMSAAFAPPPQPPMGMGMGMPPPQFQNPYDSYNRSGVQNLSGGGGGGNFRGGGGGPR